MSQCCNLAGAEQTHHTHQSHRTATKHKHVTRRLHAMCQDRKRERGPLASATPCGPWPSAKQRRVVSLDAAGQVKSFAGQQNTTNWHWQLSKRLAHFSRQLHTVSRTPPLPSFPSLSYSFLFSQLETPSNWPGQSDSQVMPHVAMSAR